MSNYENDGSASTPSGFQSIFRANNENNSAIMEEDDSMDIGGDSGVRMPRVGSGGSSAVPPTPAGVIPSQQQHYAPPSSPTIANPFQAPSAVQHQRPGPGSLPLPASQYPGGRGSPGSATSPQQPQSLPSHNGDPRVISSPPQSKLESLKSWSISTYKCTKQMVYEKLGKTSRTVDTELEAQIELLRETQRKYSNLLRLSRALSSHFYHMVQAQHQLGEVFGDLAQKSPELQDEFSYNAETQRNLTRNGETLLGALNFFVSSVNTLCNKTMEDTLLTIKLYETARVEFDAYRGDLEAMQQLPKSECSQQKLDDAQANFNTQKLIFERLRADVVVKLKFLDENRVKVMHKQLLLFHNAISAYFSGNQAALENTLRQFNIKLRMGGSAAGTPSWLEQTPCSPSSASPTHPHATSPQQQPQAIQSPAQ